MHGTHFVASLAAAGLASASVLPRNSGSVRDVVVFGDSVRSDTLDSRNLTPLSFSPVPSCQYSDNCQLWRLLSRPNVTEAYPFPNCPRESMVYYPRFAWRGLLNACSRPSRTYRKVERR